MARTDGVCCCLCWGYQYGFVALLPPLFRERCSTSCVGSNTDIISRSCDVVKLFGTVGPGSNVRYHVASAFARVTHVDYRSRSEWRW